MYASTFALLVVLFATACVDGDTPVDPDPADAADVSGLVSSVKTGEGVADLVVALVRDGSVVRVAGTGPDGRFAFDDVPAGDYVAKLTGIELAGLSTSHTAFEPPEQPLRVGAANGPLLFAVVGLIPPRVSGDVLCGGVPVAGAQIRVIGGSTDIVVTTNEQGRYGATDLGPGHHAVIAVAAPCAVAPGWTAVELLPGQAAEVDFNG